MKLSVGIFTVLHLLYIQQYESAFISYYNSYASDINVAYTHMPHDTAIKSLKIARQKVNE